MEEIWKDVKGFEGYYQVSNLGRIKSLSRAIVYKDGSIKHRKERIMKAQVLRGYCGVNLYKGGKYKLVLVHRLVADAFLPKAPGKTEVDHINTVRSDNRVENLRWTTRKENQNNPVTRAHKSIASKETAKLLRKLYEKGEISRSRSIIQFDSDETLLHVFWGATQVREKFGFNDGYISNAAKKQSFAYGYKWIYVKDYLEQNKD